MTQLSIQPPQNSWLTLKNSISNFGRSVVASLQVYPSPTPEQKAQHDDAEKLLANVRDKTYKFSDVLFKSISWLGLISVLDALRDASGYGVFLILEAVSFFSFMAFVAGRLIFPVSYVIRFFGRGSGQVRAWIAAFAIATPIVLAMLATCLIVPATVKKVVHVQRCASSSVSNPVDGCPIHKKHSSPLGNAR